MNARESIKPAIWGVIGGAIAAMVLGFNFGGWVLAGTASEMESASATAAIVQAFTPLCVTKAEQEPDKLAALKAESRWKQDDLVVESGWINNVSDKYQDAVSKACALTLVEGMKTN